MASGQNTSIFHTIIQQLIATSQLCYCKLKCHNLCSKYAHFPSTHNCGVTWITVSAESWHSIAVTFYTSGKLHLVYGRVVYCVQSQRTHQQPVLRKRISWHISYCTVEFDLIITSWAAIYIITIYNCPVVFTAKLSIVNLHIIRRRNCKLVLFFLNTVKYVCALCMWVCIHTVVQKLKPFLNLV